MSDVQERLGTDTAVREGASRQVWSVVSAAGTLLLAWVLGWKARDLAWGLWLSSLVLGYVTIVLSRFRDGNFLTSLATLLLFTFHFGFFHFIHSAFLSFLLPIDGVGEGRSMELYLAVVREYWPIVIASGIGAWPRLLRSGPLGGVLSAYMNVVRLHLMIFALVAVSFLGGDHLLMFAVVYGLMLLPIEASLERVIEDARARSSLVDGAMMKSGRRHRP
jgi:hypothetical protein